MFTRHNESTALVRASPEELFQRLDDHTQLSGHMSKSSWMMGGGSMTTETDEAGGRSVGSHIRLSGRILGMQLYVDEVVTQRNPPFEKTWETVAEPRLLVIGAYRMGFTVADDGSDSRLRVFIDYALPSRGVAHWLGRLLGGSYARWCTRRMVADAARHYAGRGPHDASNGRDKE